MGLLRYEDYLRPPGDGLEDLPECPGIYAVFNRVTRRFYVGRAINIRRRCLQHRSYLRRPHAGCWMGQDATQHGVESFVFFTLQFVQPCQAENVRAYLEAQETMWIINLGSHTEQHGYNKMIGGAWTLAARFRDHERKLLRRGTRYVMLPWTQAHEPINREMLESWGKD